MQTLRQLLGTRYSECAGTGAPGSSDGHDISYYSKCMVGGLFACGLTHTAVVPIDIVKCKIQAEPNKYKGIVRTFKQLLAAEGSSWITLGWLPTLIGYSIQGVAKFGLYELFKDVYGGFVGKENAEKYKPLIWCSASASAELIADVLLCPMEAVKVRMQTSDKGTFPTSLSPALAQIRSNEGTAGLYKGLYPLWGRQVPYTVMKFVVFERTVQFIFESVVQKTRDECSKAFNLSMTFLAGYVAGVVCAVVSHPADTIFTTLNKRKTEGPFMENAKKVYAELGPKGLWKGLGTRIIMVGTLTGLQWWIYDSWKTACGLKPTGSK